MKLLYRVLLLTFFSLHICMVLYAQDTTDFKLIVAADKGDTSTVKQLLESGANVDAKTYEGVTALMYAAQNGHTEVMKLLIDKKADIEAKPYNGITALMSAARNNQYDAAELLIKNGADINAKDKQGVTALLFAVDMGYYVMTDMLIFYGAKPLADNQGNTPLLVASLRGYTDIVALLLERGAAVNRTDELGFTPLMAASQKGYLDIVKLLTENGADAEMKTNNGFSAFTLAVQNGQDSIALFFIDKGVDVNQKTSWSVNAYRIALLNNQRSTAQILQKKGAKKSWHPYFSKLIIGQEHFFNFNDYMIGMHLGITEEKTKTDIIAGYGIRPFRKRILLEQNNDLYYQVRALRQYTFLGIDKRVFIHAFDYSQFGINIGVHQMYTFGNYEAMKQKIKDAWKTIPVGGVYFRWSIADIKINYQYFNIDAYKISPHRISFTTSFFIPINKYRTYNKTVSW